MKDKCVWTFANDFKGDTSWFTECGQLVIFSGANEKNELTCTTCNKPIEFEEYIERRSK